MRCDNARQILCLRLLTRRSAAPGVPHLLPDAVWAVVALCAGAEGNSGHHALRASELPHLALHQVGQDACDHERSSNREEERKL